MINNSLQYPGVSRNVRQRPADFDFSLFDGNLLSEPREYPIDGLLEADCPQMNRHLANIAVIQQSLNEHAKPNRRLFNLRR